MRTAKLCATVCTLSFAAMVLGTHETGNLFPWVHGFVFVSATTLLSAVIFSRISLISTTIITTILGVALRIFIFEWPASMIAHDPARYAVGVIRIMQTGNLIELKQTFATYGTLSAFHLFNSQIAIISGFTGRNVLIAIPIMIGILFPLTAVILTTYHTRSSIAVGISGTIASIAAVGVYFGYYPIVQTIAALLWVTAIICLEKSFTMDDNRILVVLFIVILASEFAHKISMLVLVGAIAGAIVIRNIPLGKIINHRNNIEMRSQTSQPLVILLLLVIGLAIQWTILTTFVEAGIIRKLLPLLSEGISFASKERITLAAVPTNSGIVDSLISTADFLPLLLVTAIASFGLWIRSRTWSMYLLLGATLTPAMILIISIVGVTIAAPQRSMMFAIPIFATILGIATKKLANLQSTPQVIAIFMIALLIIVSQAGSATLTPTYPGEPRFFLTTNEVSAKTFMMEYSEGPVAIEHFYGSQLVDLDDPSAPQKTGIAHNEVPGVIDLSGELLNATLINKSYKTLLLRNEKTSRFEGGKFRLTWNPIQVHTNSVHYNRMLDTERTVGFVNRSMSRG